MLSSITWLILVSKYPNLRFRRDPYKPSEAYCTQKWQELSKIYARLVKPQHISFSLFTLKTFLLDLVILSTRNSRDLQEEAETSFSHLLLWYHVIHAGALLTALGVPFAFCCVVKHHVWSALFIFGRAGEEWFNLIWCGIKHLRPNLGSASY